MKINEHVVTQITLRKSGELWDIEYKFEDSKDEGFVKSEFEKGTISHTVITDFEFGIKEAIRRSESLNKSLLEEKRIRLEREASIERDRLK